MQFLRVWHPLLLKVVNISWSRRHFLKGVQDLLSTFKHGKFGNPMHGLEIRNYGFLLLKIQILPLSRVVRSNPSWTTFLFSKTRNKTVHWAMNDGCNYRRFCKCIYAIPVTNRMTDEISVAVRRYKRPD